MKQYCEPAKTLVLDICGSIDAAATVTESERSTVNRWLLPKPRGTGGVVPPNKLALIVAKHPEAGKLTLSQVYGSKAA